MSYYLDQLKSGKFIRIKLNEFIHDYKSEESGWMEELYSINESGKIVCTYPVSTYEKDYYTIYTEDNFEFSIRESIKRGDDIIIEDTKNYNLSNTDIDSFTKETEAFVAKEIYRIFNRDDLENFNIVRKQILKNKEVVYFNEHKNG